ncbi:hypothetical protein H3301_gp009 [IAS virus]|uniref:hypothetical protein n=1 Tax=IAS virus TaxID=1450749 RepID=UPI00191D618B|nr:hypothetical protein H3301_gp009 [IAS virus]
MSSSLTGCTNLMVMTIKELYYFAINHSLLDKEVDVVIEEFVKDKSRDIKLKKPLDLNKVEYTFEDLIALFSN